MSDAQDAHNVKASVEAVEGNVAAHAVRNHQLAQRTVHSSCDLRVRGQDIYRAANPGKCHGTRFRGGIEEVLDDALEVGEGVSRIDYLRHVTGCGRIAGLPPALASR